jgi:glycosyltransferase involved in cell wall biosynthesis
MILTFNEECNLRETLMGLQWASRILVVDSFSTDRTLAIAAEFPQVEVIQRKFDHFAEQCNFGLTHVRTPWVLSLDADYKCTEEFADELSKLDATHAAYQARFLYAIYGKPLRTALYPPRIVLYHPGAAQYERDGHSHRVIISGVVGKLSSPILHDDWKPLSHWIATQIKYASVEAVQLMSTDDASLDWKHWLRKRIIFTPILTGVYCLFFQRLIFDGWRGLFYVLQRVTAEICLSMTLIDMKLKPKKVLND